MRNTAAELLHARQGPLVSVVIRTTFRPELVDAVAAVRAQLYRPLEALVVDAAGRGDCPPLDFGDVPWRFITQSKPLSRPQAANAGLQAAQGQWICFLDEDDFFTPSHLLGLAAALQDHPGLGVAYAGVRTLGRAGGELTFCRPFSRARLLSGNYIPIHAALMARELAQDCHFDESLEVYEDWDFFLQLALGSDFLLVPRVTAFYRATGTSAAGAAVPEARKGTAWQRLQEKWRSRLPKGWDEAAAEELERLELELYQRQQELSACRRALAEAQAELLWVKTSRTWRYTAIPRAVWHTLRRRQGFAARASNVSFLRWSPAPEVPLISVVIPIYRVAHRPQLLQEAIRSVAEQEYPNLELIAVDDGSGDGSFDLAVSLCRGIALPATVVQKANGGQSSARNVGASHAHGQWLAFLDQDDFYLPHRFTAVAEHLRPGVNLVYTDVDGVREDGTPLWQAMHQRFGCGGPHPLLPWEAAATRDAFVMPGVMTIRREFFHELGGFDENLSGYEDDDLYVRAAERGGIAYVPVATLAWRMHDASSSQTERMVASRFRYWDKLEVKAAGRPLLLRRVRRRFLRQFYRESLWSLRDESRTFAASHRRLQEAVKRADWGSRLAVGLVWAPLLFLARRSRLVRALIRSPRAAWSGGREE